MLQEPKTYYVFFSMGQLHIFEDDSFRAGYIKVGTITMDYGRYYTPKTILEQFNHDNLLRLRSLEFHISTEINALRGFKREIDKSSRQITYDREIVYSGKSLRKAERIANDLKEMASQSTGDESGEPGGDFDSIEFDE